MKVTDIPVQILFADTAMLTDGLAGVVTFMVILLLVVLTGAAHVALLVIIQLMTSPFANELLV